MLTPFPRQAIAFAIPFFMVSAIAPAFAATILPTGAKFTSTSTCQAASSISSIPSSSQRLVSGVRYNAREINRTYTDSTHVRIELNGALVWVAINGCGTVPVFQSTNTCRVNTSISGIPSGTNRLSNGSYYGITAFNQASNPASSTHVQVNFSNQLLWTAISGCGTVRNLGFGSPSPTPTPTPTPGPTPTPTPTPTPGGIPNTGAFFDSTNNLENNGFGGSTDPTPVAPALNAFDNEIVRICGAPGTVVSRTTFINSMLAFPNELTRIRQYTGGRVFGSRPTVYTDNNSYVQQLADAWFADGKGFDHIFCGEPSSSGIGGLHFYGRYLELQQKGLAGRVLNNSSRQEVVPGAVYTIGASMRYGSGQIATSTIKGYGYTLSAEDMFKIATKALRDNPTSSTSSTACILRNFADPTGGPNYNLVFVRRSTGIRTFYPDATPSTSDPTCTVNP